MKNKLIKYLIPVGAVVATTVPFVTSCAPQTAFTYDLTKISEWTPTIQPKEHDHLAPSEATETYLTDAKQNPRIVADDFVNFNKSAFAEHDFESITINILEIDLNKNYVSIKLNLSRNGTDEERILRHYDEELIIKNILVHVEYSSSNNAWKFSYDVDEEWLIANGDWSMYGTKIIDRSGEKIEDINLNKENVQEDNNMERCISRLNACFLWESYYFSNMIYGLAGE